MAKKSVATLQGKSVRFAKVIRMMKSPKTGAYVFSESVVSQDDVQEVLKGKQGKKESK